MASKLGGRRAHRPLTLSLGEATKPRTFSTSQPDRPDCGICLKTLPLNPLLCEDCQIWNDSNHVFQCLRDPGRFSERGFGTLKALLSRHSCVICCQIGNAIISRFQIPYKITIEEILMTEVTCSGPYCLREDDLRDLDPWYFEAGAQSRRMDHDDLRLESAEGHADELHVEGTSRKVRTVLYIVVTTPAGSNLHQRIQEFDSYVEEGIDFHTNESTQFNRGSHRWCPETGGGLLQPTLGVQLTLQYNALTRNLSAVERWETPFIDVGLLQSWMQTCKEWHGGKCEVQDRHMFIPRGFRAIDTYKLCVVDFADSSDYPFAALSYTWGKSSSAKELQLEKANLENLKQDGSLDNREGIPDLILDAIRLCADLGQRYLWVDRLCIIQDDSFSKHSQIQAMDRIYHLAEFTIVAAVPNMPGLGLPGVKNRPRKSSLWNHTQRFHSKTRLVVDNFDHTVVSSNWNSRGWTFQERILSRRRIYITEFQMYFQCGSFSRQEEIGDIAAALNPSRFNSLPHYLQVISDYTSRNLSFPSDILNAFVGISNKFAGAMDTTMINGLPERYLPQALLWENVDVIQRRDEALKIPTYSWAAWKGVTRYNDNAPVEKFKVGTLVQYHLQDPRQGLRPLRIEPMWFFAQMDLDNLDSLPAVDEEYPEMRFMPRAEASIEWRSCPQNPWNVHSQSLDQNACLVAKHYPGSLVFCTTGAHLSLGIHDQVEDNSHSFTILNILDHEGNVVGQLTRLYRLWVEQGINLQHKHYVIVLAAAILSEPSRYAQMHSILHISGQQKYPDADASPWYLHIMAVKRDVTDGVSRRLAVGWVKTRLWKQCKPTWNTVVLV